MKQAKRICAIILVIALGIACCFGNYEYLAQSFQKSSVDSSSAMSLDAGLRRFESITKSKTKIGQKKLQQLSKVIPKQKPKLKDLTFISRPYYLQPRSHLGSGGQRSTFTVDVCEFSVSSSCKQLMYEGSELVVKIAGKASTLSHSKKEWVLKEGVSAAAHKLGILDKLKFFDFPVQTFIFDIEGIPNLGEELLKTKVVANRLRNMQKFCDSASNCSADLFVRNDNSPNSFNNYSDLARFVKSLLKAVEILHATGYAHGDLKIENVRMSTEKTAIIADFGTGGNKSSIKRFNKSAFPFNMMPPEYILDVNLKSDLESHDRFALGVMILNYLYFPCIFSMNGHDPVNRLRWARKVYQVHGIVKLSNGVNVNSKLAATGLQPVDEKKSDWDPVKNVKRLLKCSVKGKRDDGLDALFVDLALKLMDVEPSKRLSAQQAGLHKVFTNI